jgi:3-methyladenine DNA glycosylase AlkC
MGIHFDLVKKNPKITLFILEILKDDESLYVRRSVANHLGDMTKDNL